MSEALRFWALAEGLGLLATPVAGFFLARLPGGGLALARPLGLVVIIYPAWLLASLHLLPFGDATIVLGIILIGAVSAVLLFHWWRVGSERTSAPVMAPSRLRLWLAGEVVFTVCFFTWVVLRAYAPDVWGTEKPMDMAFINAINRSPWFPPHDPWLSGATINYYYFGHLIVTYLIRLTAVEPSVGFNLGVCLMYALSASAVYGVASALYTALDGGRAHRLTPIIPGLVAAALAMVLANLDGALELLTKPGPLATFDWWDPSRVIVNTINEFPFFSFLLADLHAHMMAAPIGLVALAFAVQLALGGPRLPSTRPQSRAVVAGTASATVSSAPGAGAPLSAWPLRTQGLRLSWTIAALAGEGGLASAAGQTAVAATETAPAGDETIRLAAGPASSLPGTPPSTGWLAVVAELVLAALVVGALYALNGWDYPTELGIGLCCLYLWASAHREQVQARRVTGWAVAWVVLSVLLYLPFYLHYKAPTGGIGLVSTRGTLGQFLHDYLLIYGVTVWILAPAFFQRVRELAIPPRYLIWAGILAVALLALLAPLHLGGLAILLALFCCAVLAALDQGLSAPSRLFWFLTAAAIGLVSIGEVVYIRDVFDHGPDYRMNTIFKFGYQAWFLLAIVAGCATFWSRRWMRRELRVWWGLGLAVLVACALVYPVAGTYAREGAFTSRPTLDGLRWLAQSSPGDVAAIRWMQVHVQGAPTILEAVGVQYDPAGHARVSTFTGLPAVLGWAGHEAEWDHDSVGRTEDVKTIYTTLDLATARALLTRYDVRYVFVGSLERADFAAAGLTKFAQLGVPVFSDGGTIVYEIPAGEH